MNDGTFLVLGASSSIARWSAYELARRGHRVILAGRDMEEMQRIAGDIRIRTTAEVACAYFEAENIEGHAKFWADLKNEYDDLKGVVLAYGYMGDQEEANQDVSHALQVVNINYTSAVSILLIAAKDLEERRTGWIVGISSVAGDKGRKGNYIYGSAKGALALFLQGLRQRLAAANVRVLTVKPGFVDTPMTWGKEGVFMVADPRKAAKKIVDAIFGPQEIIYVPGFWRVLMFVIRSIPDKIFKRMNF